MYVVDLRYDLVRDEHTTKLPKQLGEDKRLKIDVNEYIRGFKSSFYAKKDLKLVEEISNFKSYLYMGIVMDGSFEGSFCSGKSLDFEKNHIIIQDLQDDIGYMKVAKNTRINTVGFLIDRDFIAQNAPKIALGTKKPIKYAQMSQTSKALAHNIFYANNQNPLGKIKTQSQILDLIFLEFSHLNTQTKKPFILSNDETRALKRAREILEHSCLPHTISEIARMVGLNEFKLKAGFKSLFGQSPYAFSLSHRLDLAKDLLQTSELSIAQISNKIGFKAQQNFSLAFKKRFGDTPRSTRLR